MSRRQVVAWGLLLVLSVGLHLWRLGDRSFHHDESVHAKLSWDLAQTGTYRYDPTYHGPVLYYLTATAFTILGDTDFTARLPVALAGIALLWVAWALRRPFGDRAAWWTGFLTTISPVMLFFGRFLRMDVLEALFASAALLSGYRAVRGSGRSWVWFGVWTGLAFATKENAYVTAALVVLTGLFLALDRGPVRVLGELPEWVGRHRWRIVTALSVFVMVTVPLMTFGFRHPADWLFPFKAIAYWWHQHEIQRVGGPWWFHLPRLAAYEFLVIGAAVAWVARRWRRLRPVELFLFVLGMTSLGMYCYLGEKVPWLGVHQVLFFLPLAGAQLARTFGPRGRWWSRELAGLALAATVVVSLNASFVLDEISPSMDRVEMLHFVQTTPELHAVAKEGQALVGRPGGTVAAVDGEAAWPLNWYWRHLAVAWNKPGRGVRPSLVVCDPDGEAEIRKLLGPGYSRERIPLRAWWLLADGHPTPSSVLRWLVTRQPWGSIGSTDVVVLRRSGEAPLEQPAEIPSGISAALGVRRAAVVGEGFLGEPRGLAVAREGELAVADAALSRVFLISAKGGLEEMGASQGWNQPEGLAWLPDGRLVAADTWNHRVAVLNVIDDTSLTLRAPEGGWYGPRGVAVDARGRIAVTDTGHRRVVVFDGPQAAPRELTPADDASPLLEPVGLAWLPRGRLLVADTGHHRLVVLDGDGGVLSRVELPAAWPDFYSRPQVVVLGPERWLATDPPRRSLWLVEAGKTQEIRFQSDDVTPAGLAWDSAARVLWMSDLAGRVWRLEVEGE